jgi:hypothetical protein
MDRDMRPELFQNLYRERFKADELAFKRAMWTILCREYFQRHVHHDDTVVDLGAGTCAFIKRHRVPPEDRRGPQFRPGANATGPYGPAGGSSS